MTGLTNEIHVDVRPTAILNRTSLEADIHVRL